MFIFKPIMIVKFGFINIYALLNVVVGYNLDTEYPIIYEILHKNSRASYFGMSVAIRPKAASIRSEWTIQIGAPRGNIKGMNVSEPGAVYRCHTFGPCRLSLVDKTYNDFGGSGIYAFRDKKDEAWIGVSMDIRNFHTHEKSIVCGNRWINQNLKNPENIDITYLMTGVCYLQELYSETSEGPVQKLLPLVNADKIYIPRPYVVDISTYHWGLGQAGTSVKLLEEPSNIIIGAPGVTHWIGSVIQYDPDYRLSVGNFARSEISRKNRYTYIGYSVTAGKFFNDKKLWFVAGAPRSANYHGEVYIFRYQDPTDNIYIQSSLVGATFGEYFGSSLDISDVNGDGMDDLIIGAPLYSNKDPDEGRIYVYLGTSQGNFLLQSQIINGHVSHGRFGSCVSSLQDLDQDGYQDVAVGAPYEDNQKGAIYIYRGFSLGLQTEYTQRISAQDLYPYLRGFGISISAAVDIDGNKYKDIAVGSYLSDHVVLLRSRPVISLNPKIRTGDSLLIDRKAPYINISLCLMYSGSNAPNYIDVLRTVDIDPIYGRGSLKASPFVKLIRLRSNNIFCEVVPIFLDLSSKNYSPLQITLKNELPPCSKIKGRYLLVTSEKVKETEGFSKWCPIGKTMEVSREIAFAGICGVDSVCRSDLQLSCDVSEFQGNSLALRGNKLNVQRGWKGAQNFCNFFRSGSYVLGSYENLLLSIKITNLGEAAQNTKIKIWSNVKLIEHNYKTLNTPNSSKKTFWIDVEGTLSEVYHTNFSFGIPFDSLNELRMDKTSESYLTLIVEVFTSSIDTNLNNNRCRFSVKLKSHAFVDFHSSSSLTSYFVSKKSSHHQLNFTHYYEIQKSGVTPIKEAELRVYIPFNLHNDFLTFDIETAEWMRFSTNYENVVFKEDDNFLTNTSLGVSKDTCPPSNRTLFLNCSNTENKCHTLKIYFTEGIPTDLSSYVKILIFMNISAIDSFIGDKDIVYFSTSATLKYKKYLESEPRQVQGSASISLYNEERATTIDGRIVGFSILAGGLLLSLIVTGLVKGNFFRRTKKEELQALKEADASIIYFATGSESAESCSKD